MQKPKSDVRNSAEIVAPNRERASDAELEFIAPFEKDDIKVVKFEESEAVEEIQRWKKALIVYVLGAKPPNNAMKQIIAIKWGKYREIKVFFAENRGLCYRIQGY